MVGRLAAGMDERERQWLAAALAALSEHVELASLAARVSQFLALSLGLEPWAVGTRRVTLLWVVGEWRVWAAADAAIGAGDTCCSARCTRAARPSGGVVR
jgi:hypothetical protein